jgi:hypothetical protein
MSRDFLVTCASREQAAATAARLASGRSADGLPLFEVDNRGDTLFVTLSYPREMKRGLAASFDGATIADLAAAVVFVAIKNGHHNGIGYFLDSGARSAPDAEPMPLSALWQRVVSAF